MEAKFTIVRKGYSPQQVDAEILRLTTEYEKILAEQKARIFELRETVGEQQKQLDAHKDKSALIAQAILNAVAKADEIERLSQQKYQMEIDHLRAFHARWLEHYEQLLAKFPDDGQLLDLSDFNQRMSQILGSSTDPLATISAAEQMYQSEEQRLAQPSKPFDPMQKIQSFLGSTSASQAAEPVQPEEQPAKEQEPKPKGGFPYQEAQNPTEDLRTIMRDLGLLD